MKIVAVMPIKLNNERCPGKNLRILGDKELLKHELDNLYEVGLIDSIYVYCSDDTIVKHIPKNVKFLQRKKELDSRDANFSQIFGSFSSEIDADIYVYAHATAPFIKIDTMKECIAAVVSGKYDSAFCAEKIQTFLWKNNKPLNFDSTNIPRTQDLEPIYKETSGIYVFKKEVFKLYHSRIGHNPYIKCLDAIEAIDIDTEEDFNFAEMIIGNMKEA